MMMPEVIAFDGKVLSWKTHTVVVHIQSDCSEVVLANIKPENHQSALEGFKQNGKDFKGRKKGSGLIDENLCTTKAMSGLLFCDQKLHFATSEQYNQWASKAALLLLEKRAVIAGALCVSDVLDKQITARKISIKYLSIIRKDCHFATNIHAQNY